MADAAKFLGVNNPNYQAPRQATPNTGVPTNKTVPAQTGGGVYWIGQDGNVYASRTGMPTQNLGQSNTLGSRSFDALNGLQEVTDPVKAESDAAAAKEAAAYDAWLRSQGGGGTGKVWEDTTEARRGTQLSLDNLEGIFQNNLSAADSEWRKTQDEYDAEDLVNKTRFDERMAKNEGTRGAQTQAGLLAAANGSRGLYSTLASIGALGGTGRLLANRAVSNEANLDIGEANKTFDTNAENLNLSYADIKKQEEKREAAALETQANAKKSLTHDRISEEKTLREKMADLWSRAGNQGEANRSLAGANDLIGKLASNTKPVNTGSYDKSGLSYQAPDLQGYLAGANDMSVSASSGGSLPINGAVFTSTKKREKLA
jgi:hypothetical protein